MTDLRKLLIEARELIAHRPNCEYGYDCNAQGCTCEYEELLSRIDAALAEPVEPDMKWLRGFINSVPFLPGIPKDDIQKAHGIIDSLQSALRVESATVETLTKTVESFQSALQRAQENHKAAEQNVSNLMAEVAQTGALLMKAESINRRMVELMKRPPDEYLNISDIWSQSCDDVEGCHLGHPTQQHYFADLLHKAMSAELLKEVGE